MKTETQIALSDKRIAAAVAVLSAHNRGQHVLAQFKRFAQGPAAALDAPGMVALVTLVTEFAQGRREFLDGLPSVVLPPKKEVA